MTHDELWEEVDVEDIAEHRTAETPPQRVVITDFDIRFWPMVTLLVKIALASIPAAIIFVIISTGFLVIFTALIITLTGHWNDLVNLLNRFFT